MEQLARLGGAGDPQNDVGLGAVRDDSDRRPLALLQRLADASLDDDHTSDPVGTQ